MGRAIVREPSVFLMDEPLSNLDAKLRVQMRAEVQRIQRRIGVATMYVTHDQIEAMTMGDRVAVLRTGTLQQVDHPQYLYDHPDNVFVAAFIGSPAMNLYEATMSDDARSVKVGSQVLPVPDDVHAARPALARYGGKRVVLGVRPEHLPAAHDGATGPTLVGNVDLIEALGSELVVHFTIDAPRVQPEGATTDGRGRYREGGRGRGPGRSDHQGQGGRADHVRRQHRGHAVLRHGDTTGDLGPDGSRPATPPTAAAVPQVVVPEAGVRSAVGGSGITLSRIQRNPGDPDHRGIRPFWL